MSSARPVKDKGSTKKDIPKDLKSHILFPGLEPVARLLISPEENKILDDRAFEQGMNYVAAELDRKLLVLAAYKGIDASLPGWERRLCLNLARMLFPGFRIVAKKHGRPNEWGFERLMALVCDIEKLKREHRRQGRTIELTDANALDILITRSIQNATGNYTPQAGQSRAGLRKTLKNQLADARNRKKNPQIALIFGHVEGDEREAMLDAIIPAFSSPEKKF